MAHMYLRDRVILVTGGGSGVGAALVDTAASADAWVVSVGRRLERLERVARATTNPERVLCVQADITQHEDVERMIQVAADWRGQLDVVVSNAGLAIGGAFEELTPEENDRVFNVNLRGPVALARASLPHLRRRPRGLFVNVCSFSALLPLPGQVIYAASKAGVRAFGEALRRELWGTSVSVVTVDLGSVDTEMNTPSARAKALAAGASVAAICPTEAARQIWKAVARDRTQVTVGARSEQLLPLVVRFAPQWFVDRLARRMQAGVMAFMQEVSEASRATERVIHGGDSPQQ